MARDTPLAPAEVGIKLAKELLASVRRAREAGHDVSGTASQAASVLRREAQGEVGKAPPDAPSRRYGAALADALVVYVRATFPDDDAAAALRGAARWLSKQVEFSENPPLEGRGSPGDVN